MSEVEEYMGGQPYFYVEKVFLWNTLAFRLFAALICFLFYFACQVLVLYLEQ